MCRRSGGFHGGITKNNYISVPEEHVQFKQSVQRDNRGRGKYHLLILFPIFHSYPYCFVHLYKPQYINAGLNHIQLVKINI